MKKYLWSPAPLVVAGFITLLLHLRGQELIASGRPASGMVAAFSIVFWVAGISMSVVWVCGCLLHDIHQWFVHRPIRRMLQEDEEQRRASMEGRKR